MYINTAEVGIGAKSGDIWADTFSTCPGCVFNVTGTNTHGFESQRYNITLP